MLNDTLRDQIHHAIIRMETDSGWRVVRQHIRGEIQSEDPAIGMFRGFLLQELADLVDKCIKEEKRIKEEGL